MPVHTRASRRWSRGALVLCALALLVAAACVVAPLVVVNLVVNPRIEALVSQPAVAARSCHAQGSAASKPSAVSCARWLGREGSGVNVEPHVRHSFYVWSVDNPAAVLGNGSAPHVVEVGPLHALAAVSKHNVTVHGGASDAGTRGSFLAATYTTQTHWVPDISGGGTSAESWATPVTVANTRTLEWEARLAADGASAAAVAQLEQASLAAAVASQLHTRYSKQLVPAVVLAVARSAARTRYKQARRAAVAPVLRALEQRLRYNALPVALLRLFTAARLSAVPAVRWHAPLVAPTWLLGLG